MLVKSPKATKKYWHISQVGNRIKTLCLLSMPINSLVKDETKENLYDYPICGECKYQKRLSIGDKNV